MTYKTTSEKEKANYARNRGFVHHNECYLVPQFEDMVAVGFSISDEHSSDAIKNGLTTYAKFEKECDRELQKTSFDLVAKPDDYQIKKRAGEIADLRDNLPLIAYDYTTGKRTIVDPKEALDLYAKKLSREGKLHFRQKDRPESLPNPTFEKAQNAQNAKKTRDKPSSSVSSPLLRGIIPIPIFTYTIHN